MSQSFRKKPKKTKSVQQQTESLLFSYSQTPTLGDTLPDETSIHEQAHDQSIANSLPWGFQLLQNITLYCGGTTLL